MLINVAVSWKRNVIRKEAKKILKYRPYNRNTAHVECKNKIDTSNNRGSWNHFKIIKKVSEQNTGEERKRGTTKNNYTGHCTHTNGRAQNIYNGK